MAARPGLLCAPFQDRPPSFSPQGDHQLNGRVGLPGFYQSDGELFGISVSSVTAVAITTPEYGVLPAVVKPSNSTTPRFDRRLNRQPKTKRRIAWLAFTMALGVLIIAVAYAEARSGASWANIPMWIGQLTIYLSPIILLCSRTRVTNFEGRSIALLVAAATFAVLICYSPSEFLFRDEFQHLNTIQTILVTHHLFHANPNLTVSPYFPSLEIGTSAVVFLGNSSIFVAGTIILFTAHMVTALGLFLVFYEITHSNRISGIAIVLYAMGPHYEFFDSYFIYQNVAVPFLVLTLLAVLKLIHSPPGTKSHMWGAAAFTFAVLTTVSHHVTSYALLGLLGCFALSCVVMRSAGRRDWRPLVITLLTVGVIVIWDFAIAKGMVGYLKPVIDAFVSTNAIPSPAGLTQIGSSAQANKIICAAFFGSLRFLLLDARLSFSSSLR